MREFPGATRSSLTGALDLVSTPWATSLDVLLEKLSSSPVTGLSGALAQSRLQQFGKNQLRAARHGPLREAIVSQLRNPLLWLLTISAVLSALAGEATDATIVVIILSLSALVSILQESRAGHALELLKSRMALRAQVVRDGVELDVPTTTIVPGDIVLLTAGSLVPADAIVIESKDLYLNEAPLTGEAFATLKRPGRHSQETALSERTNMVFMGTNVRSGTGRVVVTDIGVGTAFGQLASRLVMRAPETEFQSGMRRFGYLLLKAMVVLIFVVFAASAVRRHSPVEALLFAVALAVGLAPEMLPAVLSTMLSRGARRMADRGVLVRRLETIENLGCMNVLCTDKTGTLTQGAVRLESALDPFGKAQPNVAVLAFYNASLQSGLANPLDRAIVDSFANQAPPLAKKLDEIPYDFARKRLSVQLQLNGQPAMLITKGAFKEVLPGCVQIRMGEACHNLTEVSRQRLLELAEGWSRQGLRVLAVATRELAEGEAINPSVERDEVLEGFLTFRDPVKPGAAQAIADLRELGVTVKVVSGDHHGVVEHLAKEIGWPEPRVAVGADLAGLGEPALRHLVETVDLFAEVDPGQKERILMAIKSNNHVVGFMGDGINDSPSIHAADVGISVDGATDVAREAADFVLLKQDLGTLRDGIREGRATFANTMKYVLTTESANLGNMVSMAAASLFLPFLPLLAHQVLLNNLLSDIPSMTLSTDRVDPEVVVRPQRWNIAFLRRFMFSFGLLSALFDGITFFTLRWGMGASMHVFRTAWFVESLFTELLVLLVLRTRRPCWRSRPHPALLVSTLAVLTFGATLPLTPLGRMLEFVSLPAPVWSAVFLIALAYVATIEAVKRPLLSYLERTSPTSFGGVDPPLRIP